MSQFIKVVRPLSDYPLMKLMFAALYPMERCIAYTMDYCRERKVFGKPLLDNQVVHFRLGELATEVELLRSLVYRAVGK